MSSPEARNHGSPLDGRHNTTVDVNMSFNVAHEDTQPQSNMLQSVVSADTESGSNTKQTLFGSNQHHIQTT